MLLHCLTPRHRGIVVLWFEVWQSSCTADSSGLLLCTAHEHSSALFSLTARYTFFVALSAGAVLNINVLRFTAEGVGGSQVTVCTPWMLPRVCMCIHLFVCVLLMEITLGGELNNIQNPSSLNDCHNFIIGGIEHCTMIRGAAQELDYWA